MFGDFGFGGFGGNPEVLSPAELGRIEKRKREIAFPKDETKILTGNHLINFNVELHNKVRMKKK